MHIRTILAGILLAVGSSAAVAQEPELAPLPRVATSPVRVEPIQGGYQIILSRPAAENLRDTLAAAKDGSPYTDILQAAAKKHPEYQKHADIIAFVVRTQTPALKKALDEKIGPGGAIIKVFGLETERIPVKKHPIAKAAIEAFVPENVKDHMKTTVRVVNTTPLYWRVETRND